MRKFIILPVNNCWVCNAWVWLNDAYANVCEGTKRHRVAGVKTHTQTRTPIRYGFSPTYAFIRLLRVLLSSASKIEGCGIVVSLYDRWRWKRERPHRKCRRGRLKIALGVMPPTSAAEFSLIKTKCLLFNCLRFRSPPTIFNIPSSAMRRLRENSDAKKRWCPLFPQYLHLHSIGRQLASPSTTNRLWLYGN